MAEAKTAFQILREPFPPDKIEQIPRGNTKLDYVSHATTTDRLLSADPQWTWEPLGRDEHGAPKMEYLKEAFSDPAAKVGLWIVLKVAGTETPGFGEGKNYKEAIGDAIRNAAMRRGVALDLWAKVDLVVDDAAAAKKAPAAKPKAEPAKTEKPTDPSPERDALMQRSAELMHEYVVATGDNPEQGHADIKNWSEHTLQKQSRAQMDEGELAKLCEWLVEATIAATLPFGDGVPA